jgi:POT family proton-dependent oligopeptide transporter
MILMALSFGVMVAAGAGENATESRVALGSVPPRVLEAMQHQKEELAREDGVNTGRLSYDEAKHELVVHGVLPDYTVTALLEATADRAFLGAVDLANDGAKKGTIGLVSLPSTYSLPEGQTPAAYAKKLSEKGVGFDAQAATLRISKPLDPGTRAEILGGSAPSEWQDGLRSLRKKSLGARVSGWWLILSYFLATVGELLLSPVGLSMVTKLAPARFASLFMGVWMLASSVAQYAGGSIGELWTKMTPTTYFEVFVVSSLVAAAILAMLVVPLRRLMHEAA